MKTFTKIIFNIIFMLSLIESKTVIEDILADNPQVIDLEEEMTQFMLRNASKANSKVLVELLFTHPSKYNITFNPSEEDEEEEEEDEGEKKMSKLYSVHSNQEPLLFENAQNANKFYVDKDLNKIFIHPLRKLSTTFDDNFTTVVEDELISGMHRIVLELGEDENTPVILTVFRKEEKTEDDPDEKMYINYKIGEPVLDLKDTKVKVKQDKDMLNIEFKGIEPEDEDLDLKDVSVEYTINLFNKTDLESKYENIYAYRIDNQVESLYTKNIKLKGNNVKQNIYLVIQAPLNDKKDQLLLIDAVVKNGEEEIVLQYESKEFKVEEKSPEREWPEDDESDTTETDTTETDTTESDTTESDSTETDKTETDKTETDKTETDTAESDSTNTSSDKTDDDDKDNKEKNRKKLFIIIVCFTISVLLTLLIIVIYIKCSTNQGKIEEEKDYKDVGGIVINDDNDKNDGPTTKGEGKKINEEEE